MGKVCYKCGDQHKGNCSSQEFKCSNCIQAAKKFDIEIDIKHKVFDEKYPCYQKVCNRLKSRTNYNLDSSFL